MHGFASPSFGGFAALDQLRIVTTVWGESLCFFEQMSFIVISYVASVFNTQVPKEPAFLFLLLFNQSIVVWPSCYFLAHRDL